MPHEDGWAIKEEGHDKSASTFKHKNKAVDEARK
ncbi:MULTISPECIES: DUF2188 domain-containing protein [unclassified Paenibacillus]|nr:MULTISPECIES: DUF2188 domain-containing protein [unclassified Paenibacillus]